MPTQQQVYDDGDPPITQAVQIWGEGPEIVPYAAGFTPPYPKALVPGYTGYGVSGTSSFTDGNGTTGSSSQVPDAYDLHWVAGDTAEFDFYFDGVCWTLEEPTDTLSLAWVKTNWESHVRAQGWTYYGYWWPPTWPGYRHLMAFTVTATFMADFNALGPGTMIHLQGGTIWPGDFLWDLQSTQWPDPLLDPTKVRTWLSGKAKVDPQVTQQALIPPSNWPVYQQAWQ